MIKLFFSSTVNRNGACLSAVKEEISVADVTSKMMEEVALGTDVSDSYDSFDEQYDRPTERWAPLGAAAQEPEPGASGVCSEHTCVIKLSFNPLWYMS